jgi:hypothetical protein
MNLTWKLFKEVVEAQGVKDDDKLDFIDISADGSPIRVCRDEYGENDGRIIIR